MTFICILLEIYAILGFKSALGGSWLADELEKHWEDDLPALDSKYARIAEDDGCNRRPHQASIQVVACATREPHSSFEPLSCKLEHDNYPYVSLRIFTLGSAHCISSYTFLSIFINELVHQLILLLLLVWFLSLLILASMALWQIQFLLLVFQVYFFASPQSFRGWPQLTHPPQFGMSGTATHWHTIDTPSIWNVRVHNTVLRIGILCVKILLRVSLTPGIERHSVSMGV